MDLLELSQKDTLPKVLKYNTERYKGHFALKYKKYGIWQSLTWQDYFDTVKRFAFGFLSIGIKKGDTVIIVADNMPEWYFSELALYSIGAVSFGLNPDIDTLSLASFIRKFDVKFLILSDQEQIDKFLEIKTHISSVQKVVFFNYRGLARYKDPFLLGIREVLKKGEELKEKDGDLVERLIEEGKSQDPCTILFTSGIEDEHRTVIHTHGSIIENLMKYFRSDGWKERDRIIPFFPPFGLLDKWFSIGAHLLSGSILFIAERPETYLRDLREARPTVVFFNGKIWEKRKMRIEERMAASDSLKRFAYRLFMEKIGKNGRKSLLFSLLRRLGEVIIYKPIKRELGLSNVRFCYNTGPILNDEVFNFYHRLGIPLKNLYWLTEAGIVAFGERENLISPLEGIEVELSKSGEITVREGMKKEVLFTGDRGILKDGKILFVDRIDGILEIEKNRLVSFQVLESLLRSNPYIKDAMIFGKDSELFALLFLDEEWLRSSAGLGGEFISFEELFQRKEIYNIIEEGLRKINERIDEAKICRYVIVPETHRLFNPYGLLKKGHVRKVYKEIIEAVIEKRERVKIAFKDGEIELPVRVMGGA